MDNNSGKEKIGAGRPQGTSPPTTTGISNYQDNGLSASGRIEHNDPLRSSPKQEQKTSPSSGHLSEYGDED